MASNLNEDEDDLGIFTNKATVMANFEEWIKMATDNKINSRNSWDFALIDYFHDLNVLKDSEDNINFQRASATLDGCVKIYSSRVDSVATETGKLLSGLAERKNADNSGGGRYGQDGEENADDDDAVTIDPHTGLPMTAELQNNTTRRRNYNRVLETTLVDFDTLRIRELDQELAIDPLFKKALADFDEGGAKSLLINTLHVDESGRVVFDASTNHSSDSRAFSHNQQAVEVPSGQDNSEGDAEDEDRMDVDESHVTPPPISSKSEGTEKLQLDDTSLSIDMEDEILALGMEMINFDVIGKSEVCPSMKQLRMVMDNVQMAKSFIDTVNRKPENFLSEEDLKETSPADEKEELDADGYADSFDQNDDFENGQIAREIEEHRGLNGNASVDYSALDSNEDDKSAADIITSLMDNKIMAYFDETLRNSWRGREHWKVRNLKQRLQADEVKLPSANDGTPNAEEEPKDTTKNKKPKDVCQINFFEIDSHIEERVFIPLKRTNIEMPFKMRKSADRFLLPDDYQFSTQKVTKLFIKPEQYMSFFTHKSLRNRHHEIPETAGFDVDTDDGEKEGQIADENFWAKEYEQQDNNALLGQNGTDGGSALADGGNDSDDIAPEENDAGIDFNQAFSEAAENSDTSLLGPPLADAESLTQTSVANKEGKVNYSRTAKRVDVRRLKDNIWKSIISTVEDKELALSDAIENDPDACVTLSFTDITEKISSVYTGDSKKDLSTSFCFICLLHLANEHALEVADTEDYLNLTVKIPRSLIHIQE